MDEPCRCCHSIRWMPWRPAGTWRYLRCQRCGLVRIDPFPTPGQLAQVFDQGYFVDGGARGGYVDYDADADLHRANAATRLGRLPVSSQPGARLLVDVGCASGHTLDEAVTRGWSVAGVEVSPQVAQRARDRGHRVEASLAQLADLAGTADAVCFFQVLEHLPDPVAALRQAAELLRPGGVVLCETWDGASLLARLSGARWQQLSPPSVLWVFDRGSTEAMLAAAGLELGHWRRSTKLVSLRLVLGQLGVALPGRLAGLGRVRLRYGLGDLITLEARATSQAGLTRRGPTAPGAPSDR